MLDDFTPSIYYAPLDWKMSSVPVFFSRLVDSRTQGILETIARDWQRREQMLRDDLAQNIFADGLKNGVSQAEERYGAACDHCGGFWDSLFSSQGAADQWFVQHRAVCLTLPPPSLVGR